MVASLWMYQSKFNFAWKEAATPRFHFWCRLDARSDPPLHNHGGCNGHTWWGKRRYTVKSWLVVSTPLKNITSSQLGWLLFLIYVKIKTCSKPPTSVPSKGLSKTAAWSKRSAKSWRSDEDVSRKLSVTQIDTVFQAIWLVSLLLN